jgi:hypothetical protein
MKLRITLLGIAVAVVTCLGMTAASASPPPGATRVQAQDNGWLNLAYKPGTIYAGNGCAPFVAGLSWSTWTASAATTRTGTLRQCGKGRPVTVYLHYVKSHDGTHYFAKMRWAWTSRNGSPRVEYWKFETYPGGSVPFWNPS